jgi:hypothetical protein
LGEISPAAMALPLGPSPLVGEGWGVRGEFVCGVQSPSPQPSPIKGEGIDPWPDGRVRWCHGPLSPFAKEADLLQSALEGSGSSGGTSVVSRC